jgi:hypothetical protein
MVQGLLLIISELVTNAVRHAAVLSPQIVVEVVIGGGSVRVSVEDGHPYRPKALQRDYGRTGGRGLLLVKSIALEAGGACDSERTADGGKAVWASLPIPSADPGAIRADRPGEAALNLPLQGHPASQADRPNAAHQRSPATSRIAGRAASNTVPNHTENG